MKQLLEDLKTVRLDSASNRVVILDQTRLPGAIVYRSLGTPEEVYEAIYRLRVRGAPAIGVTAAYGIYVCCRALEHTSFSNFYASFSRIRDYLASSRPTAVNLMAALERMERCVMKYRALPIDGILERMEQEAHDLRNEDAASCRRIGEHALSLLRPGMGLLTHCNAGHLATSEYGTALAPIYLGQERGYGFRVFADETRPLLQGARLTAFELQHAGVDVTLICDNMASIVMHNGWVDAVVVGCDRIAANGDAANKIGTSGVAVLARHYGIPFYVLGPTSTIDMRCPSGDAITIEERPSEEITEMWYTERMAPAGVKTYNPAFDVTPADLITAIITEKGIARAPYNEVFESWFM